MIRTSQEILRAVGDALLAFMLLGGGPLDENHTLLEFDDRPAGDLISAHPHSIRSVTYIASRLP
jgi:hypothetical protein